VSGARHVVVSTHFDDAVLSLGGALLALGGDAAVVTVRGGVPAPGTQASWWDRACGFADAAEAARTRRREDAAACAASGAAAVHLDFLDRPYAPADERLEDVAAAVARHVPREATLWLPAAIGGHPDHVATRDALLPLARRRAGPLVVYADTPYACAEGWETPDAERDPDGRWQPQLHAFAAVGIELGEPARLRLDARTTARKVALLRLHATQLHALGRDHPRLCHVRGDLATEVRWDARAGGIDN
jgi:LmbE family N-acetylglucosaminyl deacetylase